MKFTNHGISCIIITFIRNQNYRLITTPEYICNIFVSISHSIKRINNHHNYISIFNCYGPALAQFHKTNLSADIVAAMPPKRQTLFRGVWQADFGQGRSNNYFAAENLAQ